MIKPDLWKPAGGLTLEPNAEAAVRSHDRNLAVTAGPGSGKTELLAQRADFLLRTGGCRYPRRILAISFKTDAARNLRDRVLSRCGYQLAARLDSHTFHAFAKRIIDRYRPVLSGKDELNPDYSVGDKRVHRQQITFGDMVPMAATILETSAVARSAVRQTYSHVFLDEFQDCTAGQYSLLKLAFHGTPIRLTAVGDMKQRIMGWVPDSLEKVVALFIEDFAAQGLTLYQNYRSQPRLRRMQNAMVKVMEPAAAVRDSDIEGDGGHVETVSYVNDSAEAEALATRIRDWIHVEGVQPSEIAVLIRHSLGQYARHLMSALERLGVAFRDEQALQDLSAEPLVRFLIDFLLVVVGDREPDAYANLMQAVGAAAGDDDAIYRQRATWQQYIDQTRSKLLELSTDADVHFFRREAAGFLTHIGAPTVAMLSPDYEQSARVVRLVDETFDRVGELLAVHVDPRAALSCFNEDHAIRIMTIHKCKGLEFDTVVVLGVENEMFFGNANEARSAYFVAISRARNRLVLTTADRRPTPPGHTKRWDVRRSPHVEFLKYATAAK